MVTEILGSDWRESREDYCVGGLFTPRMNVYYASPPTFVDLFLTDFMTVGITTIVGAFVGYRFDAHAQKMAWR